MVGAELDFWVGTGRAETQLVIASKGYRNVVLVREGVKIRKPVGSTSALRDF